MTKPPYIAHSLSEYKRLEAQGVDVLPPDKKFNLNKQAEIDLGIVPYHTDELVMYSSKFGEYDQILAYKKGFLKALELVESEINRTHETKRYSQELLNYIQTLKANPNGD